MVIIRFRSWQAHVARLSSSKYATAVLSGRHVWCVSSRIWYPLCAWTMADHADLTMHVIDGAHSIGNVLNSTCAVLHNKEQNGDVVAMYEKFKKHVSFVGIANQTDRQKALLSISSALLCIIFLPVSAGSNLSAHRPRPLNTTAQVKTALKLPDSPAHTLFTIYFFPSCNFFAPPIQRNQNTSLTSTAR